MSAKVSPVRLTPVKRSSSRRPPRNTDVSPTDPIADASESTLRIPLTAAMFNELKPVYSYRADVVRSIDGDTFVLDIDLGFNTTRRETVRLIVSENIAIDAPEKNTPEGKAALKFAAEWFVSHPHLMVETIRDRKEKYGRYLAIIRSEETGENLGEDLLAAGHAVVKKY